ncbi:MAG: hypothetical protein ABIU05_18680, partial [Nitrospirales bacterium]
MPYDPLHANDFSVFALILESLAGLLVGLSTRGLRKNRIPRELKATAVRIRLRHIPLVGILCSSAILMQGCTVVAWIGMVSADTARNSDVKFESFEHAWVAPPEKQQQVPLKRIAVAPFVGELRMAEWWATVLGQTTDRDVISPAEVTSRLPPNVLTQLTQSTTDQDDIALAPQISRDLQVDGVLFGRVVDGPPQKVFLGLKERYPQRLYLHLVSVEGTLLWKVELPFTVVKGTKEIDEEMVKQNLLT